MPTVRFRSVADELVLLSILFLLFSISSNDCLLVVDAVSTLGAVELLVDEWQIDAAFAASQKALGGPAGLAPVTLGPRALARIAKRATPPPVYFYDANLLKEFWKCTDAPRL